MTQLFKTSSLFIIFSMLFVSIYLVACTSPKEQINVVTVPKTKNKIKKGKNVMISYNDKVRLESSYKNIRGNVRRLKAMISGQFVQYNTKLDTAREKYSVWYVNGGSDSMMLYQLPVGNTDKDGHWMYHYQYMTSLPAEPIYEYFSKMTEINRDSIVAVYYKVPADFDATVFEILAKPEDVFHDFDFEHLELAETGEEIHYKRKHLLEYEGLSILRERNRRGEEEGGFYADYYLVTSDLLQFGFAYYSRDKEFIARTIPEYLIKKGMVNDQYITH